MNDERLDPGGAAGSTESARDAPRLPERIGDFRIVRRLGAGGMGIVYEAEQLHPKRPVALKVIRGGAYVDEQQIKLFKREAQTLARLKHPSIAAIYEMGRTDEGQHFFAMELVRGETLDAWLKHHPDLDLRTRLGIFRKLCEAVAYAHQRGAIHRDLKPLNVIVLKESPIPASSPEAGIPEVKILDFGLARITDHDMAVTTVVTDAGTVRGTLPYMSPEQVRGNPDEIDVRTDVYSLGVMLYELLTGQLPYDVQRKSLPEAVRIITEEPPRPLTKTWSGTGKLDAEVGTIAHKALEKEPARRYQSVASLGEDVQRYLSDQPILARPPSALYQLRKLVSRHRYAAGVVVGLFVVLAVFAVAMAVQASRIARERDRANAERDRANQEAATAKQVSDFLVELFEVADPSEARGTTITAREILDRGAEKIERELRDQPATQAQLMLVMGEVYLNLALHDRSEALLERAVALRRDTDGDESVAYAKALNALGWLYWYEGRYKDAIDLHREALATLEPALGPSALDVGWTRYYIGASLNSAGALEDARTNLEQALEIFRSELGSDSRYVAWCLNDLGSNRLTAGDLSDALTFFERAYEIKKRALPTDHPDRLQGLNNVGYVLMELGRYDEARPLLEEALAAQERVSGPEHVTNTLFVMHSLGELHRRAGDLAKAAPLLERAAEGTSRSLGPDHLAVAQALRSLALLAEAQGDLARADSLFRRSIAAFSANDQDYDHARTLEEHAALLRRMGRTEEASRREAEARRIPERRETSARTSSP